MKYFIKRLVKMSKKVCILTSVHSPFDVRIFQKEARSLVKAGYEVTLIAQHDKEEIVDGVRIVNLQRQSNRIKRMTKTVWEVYQKARTVDADIYHFHDPELLPIGLILRKGKRCVIYDAHEDYPRLILSKHWIHHIIRKTLSSVFEFFEDYVAKRINAIVCATPYILDRFKLINPTSIDVNNFPIQTDFFSSSKEKTFSRSICFPGLIARSYGINELIGSIEVLHNVKLILCGPFESQAYADELKSMPGWKFVDYRGVIGHGEVVTILASCAVGVVTLLPSATNNYSLPIKMFEYMAAGLPVIASNFPLWKEIIEKNKCGICVNPLNPDEIATAINWVLQNPSDAAEMGRNGSKAVLEKYNWEVESRKLISFYEQLLK
jgi:glycosyltransferase involved in cell wall biosynthesis